MTATVEIARVEEHTDVLGPGTRACVWVQGCPQRCPGCVATEMLAFGAGRSTDVDVLAQRLLSLDEITGVTFSGGEPFSQAAALENLCSTLRGARPEISLMSYTGWTLERLQSRGTPTQRSLLGWLDLLIDGRYVERRHASLRWRGSSNQRIHFLTERHADLRHAPDVSAGMEFKIDRGAYRWTGVPPVTGFRSSFDGRLRELGFETEGVER
jgi:anaerobic ribonucleoside-triphosphate reductase activating protein